jgi:hypothetical protein
MSYRRRHRWFRRMAFGLAFASVLFAGRVSVAAAKADEDTSGSRYVAAGGWSGQVDMESGIPLSAGIPHGDEQFVDPQALQVIPYLSQGVLTEADAQALAAEAIHDPFLSDIFVRPGESLDGPVVAAEAIRDRPSVSATRPDGDEIAIRNAIEAQTLAAAEAIRDPYVSPGVLGEAMKTNVAAVKFVPGVTDFPTTPQTTPLEVSSSGSTLEWNDALTVGIGALVLALGLGLAFGYLRRPRLAGL